MYLSLLNSTLKMVKMINYTCILPQLKNFIRKCAKGKEETNFLPESMAAVCA